MKVIGILALAAYISTIWLANWLIQRYGVVSVGLGLSAPAGVYAAGLAFTLRDITQDTLGRRAVLIAIVVGGCLSYLISPSLAAASAVAFLCSELADYLVYTPLRERRWLLAVALSNVAGLLFDSVLFLWLAFHSLAYLDGQVLGKLEMTLAAVLVLQGWRLWAQPERVRA